MMHNQQTWIKGGIFLIILVSLITIWTSFTIAESDFPVHPIEVVIPYAPGGGMDSVMNAFKDRVGKILGRPIITTFKAGAGGATGVAYVTRSKPDGYTLCVSAFTSHIVFPLTKKDLGYTLDDLAPVCVLTRGPIVWTVRDDSPYKSMQDFIQVAKTKKMKYATYGSLSLPHILTEAMGRKAGFQPIHVPFPGGGPAFTAALGGHVDMAAANSMAGLIGPGRLRILAVGLDRRFETYPEIPTLAELGFPCSYGEFSIWAPKGTPKERINKIYEAFKKTTDENKKEITAYLLSVEQKLTLLGPEEMWNDTQAQYAVLKKLVGEMGLLADQHK